MIVINSTKSLRESTRSKPAAMASDPVDGAVVVVPDFATTDIESLQGVDTSPVIFSITSQPIQGATDITVRLHSAIGPVRRLVINGNTTVEQFIVRLRDIVSQ